MDKQDECLSRVEVNPMAREFHLYSDDGDSRHVRCETLEEFMNVLDFCKRLLDEDTLKYVDPTQPIMGQPDH